MEDWDELTARVRLWIPDFPLKALRRFRLPADIVSRLPGTCCNPSEVTGEVSGRFGKACHCRGSGPLVVGRECVKKDVATDGPALVLREDVARADSFMGSGSACESSGLGYSNRRARARRARSRLGSGLTPRFGAPGGTPWYRHKASFTKRKAGDTFRPSMIIFFTVAALIAPLSSGCKVELTNAD